MRGSPSTSRARRTRSTGEAGVVSRVSLGANGASLARPHTPALTSKQRVFSTDLLQSVVRVLRAVGPPIEVAALQQAMLDAEANEYLTAAMAQAEAEEASDVDMLATIGTVPSVSFLHMEGDIAQAVSGLSSSVHPAHAVRLATVLPTSDVLGEGRHRQHREHAPADASVTEAAASSHTRSGSSASEGHSPSVTRTPRSVSRFSALHAHSAEVSFKDQVAQTEVAGGQGFLFPRSWFSAAAVDDFVGRPASSTVPPLTPQLAPAAGGPTHHVPSSLNTGMDGSGRPELLSTTQRSAAASLPSVLPAEATSSSQSTAAYAGELSPLGARLPTDPRFESSTAASRDSELSSSDAVSGAAPSAFGPFSARPTAVTAQPPLLLDNMLLDPSTGGFLFGGHAFREETRVIYVPGTMLRQGGRRDEWRRGNGSRLGSARRASATVPASASAPSHIEPPATLLVREYFPVTPIMTASGSRALLATDGCSSPGGDDVVLQCFSLLPPWMTQLSPNRYQLLSEEETIACVCQALPGCLTVVTALSRFLRGERSVSQAAPPSPQQEKGPHESIEAGGDATLHGPAGLLGSLVQHPRDAMEAAMLQSNSSFNAALMSGSGPPVSLRRSLGSSASTAAVAPPAVWDAREAEAARIDAAAGRLAALPPDVVDEAVAAVRFSLDFYCEHAQLRQRVRDVLGAVRVLQRFFRRCLGVKARALRRMTRLWRKLEVEARAKLQQHRPLPSAVARIDAVANSVLQEHMLTSAEYKRKFIREEWTRRRAAYARWREEETWNAVFAEEHAVAPSSVPAGKDFGQSSGHATRPQSARLTAGEEMRMVDAFVKRQRRSSRLLQAGTAASSRPSPSPALSNVAIVAAATAAPTPPASQAEVDAMRTQSARRRFCSWYIDPHELLYRSHQRLLETLKGTVLRIEEVQGELSRAAAEADKDTAAGASAMMAAANARSI